MAIIRRAGKTDITKLINLIKNRFGNVENKSGATIRSEMTKEEVVEALGYDPAPVNKENLLQNVEQYTNENPLVYMYGNEFYVTCNLKSGKWYSLSFDIKGYKSLMHDEIGIYDPAYLESGHEYSEMDIIDIINSGDIYYDNFHFKAKHTGEYRFYINMFNEDNNGSKIYNFKLLEGYTTEMVNTIMEIKSQITKTLSLSIDEEKDALIITYEE